jgi:hypothetical protein
MKVSRTPWSSDLDIHVPEYGDIAVSTRISSAATKQAAEAAFISFEKSASIARVAVTQVEASLSRC